MEYLSHTQILRPVGQLLDSLRIDCFAITMDSEGVVIRDKTRNRAQVTPRERAFLADLESHHVGAEAKVQARRLAEGVLEWRLDWADIERLEREGQSQRRKAGQAPDANSLPQILRVLGGVVDQKRGQLLSISKEPEIVRLEYQSSNGQRVSEEFTMPTLYDHWVRMYKRRDPSGER
jgi:hypothetical protein